jgi:Polyprenyl synthetase
LEDSAGWYLAVSSEVLSRAEREIRRWSDDDDQRDLMISALSAGRLARMPARLSAAAHLPLLCAAAVRPDGPLPLPLAVPTSLLWSGLELYDDLTDGDLAPALQARSDPEIVFTAFGLSCLLPAALVAELEIPLEARARMQQCISRHLLRGFAGQQRDLGHVDCDAATPAAVAAAACGKNGEPAAMFAALGAMAAGATPDLVEAYGRFGRALGVMAQYQSDFWELFHDEDARDLRQGNRTFLLVSALERARDHEREELLGLLHRARSDTGVDGKIRDILRQGRLLAPWREAVHQAAGEGHEALAAARPAEPAASLLRAAIRQRTPAC